MVGYDTPELMTLKTDDGFLFTNDSGALTAYGTVFANTVSGQLYSDICVNTESEGFDIPLIRKGIHALLQGQVEEKFYSIRQTILLANACCIECIRAQLD